MNSASEPAAAPDDEPRARRGPKIRVAALPLPRLRRADALLLVVDAQEKLLPAVRFGPRVLERATILAKAAQILGVPALVTEQNPARLGPTSEPLLSALGEAPTFAKMQFSALTPPVLRELERQGRPSIVLCGLESHVCVLQTALDLIERGRRVFVVQDSISSRRALDEAVALERMRGAGATLTTAESALLEMLGSADAPEFKAVLRLIK